MAVVPAGFLTFASVVGILYPRVFSSIGPDPRCRVIQSSQNAARIEIISV